MKTDNDTDTRNVKDLIYCKILFVCRQLAKSCFGYIDHFGRNGSEDVGIRYGCSIRA